MVLVMEQLRMHRWRSFACSMASRRAACRLAILRQMVDKRSVLREMVDKAPWDHYLMEEIYGPAAAASSSDRWF